MDGFCPQGVGLLHVAASSGIPAVVAAVAEWCAAAGTAGRWQLDAKGPRGLTPLHYAAMLPNSADMRRALAGERGGAAAPGSAGSCGAPRMQRPSSLPAEQRPVPCPALARCRDAGVRG